MLRLLPTATSTHKERGSRGGDTVRIAYICTDPTVPVFGWRAGAVRVEETIRALMAHGAQIDLFVAHLGGDPPPGLEAVRIHQLPAACSDRLPNAERATLTVIRHLRAATAAESAGRGDAAKFVAVNCDLRAAVAAGSPEQDEATRFLAVNRELRAALEQAGSFDLVYERHSQWSFVGMEYARASGVPGLLEVIPPAINRWAQRGDAKLGAGHEWVAQQVFSAAHALITTSDGGAAYLRRYPAAEGRVHLIPNGVNPDRFPTGLRPSLRGSPGTFTVGFVGGLKPWSGLPTLIDAFAILHREDPTSRLLIVGDGPQQDDLLAHLSARGLLDAARLTGAVPPSAIPGLLATMDVAVAPYPNRPYSSFSLLKVYEYMAAGVPVVASRISQLARLIHDGTNGVLYQPGDPVALARSLRFLRSNAEARSRIGQAGRSTVLRAHTWQIVAGNILELAGLTNAPRPARAEMSS